MSCWRIRSAELRRRRIAKMLSIAQLARLALISERGLRALEAKDKGVSEKTLECFIKIFECTRADIATYVDTRANATKAAQGESVETLVTTATEAIVTAPAPRATRARASSDRVTMADLRAAERELPPAEPRDVDGESIPKLTVLSYQQCYSAYLARDGERYWVEGIIVRDRGISPGEAALIGARSGVAACFEVSCPVGSDGHVLGITAHTDSAEMTLALQRLTDNAVRFVVRVVALNDPAPGKGFTFFQRERPSPWGLVVERLLDTDARVSTP